MPPASLRISAHSATAAPMNAAIALSRSLPELNQPVAALTVLPTCSPVRTETLIGRFSTVGWPGRKLPSLAWTLTRVCRVSSRSPGLVGVTSHSHSAEVPSPRSWRAGLCEDGEYVGFQGRTANRIESFWSYLKCLLAETRTSVNVRHLERYTEESEFRFNHRFRCLPH